MSQPFPDDPFLRGNFEPWLMEGECFDLPVDGEIPRALNGTLYRNGPNPPFAPRGTYHWFDGDGMIHAFGLQDGKARYRNRWVRTARFQLEQQAGEALFGGLACPNASDERAMGTAPNAANTNIVFHAGRLLALWEAGLPHRLDARTLETVGPFNFGGKLSAPMTAHPKLDPETGEMLFFGYSVFPPHVQYHVVGADGVLVRTVDIDTPVPVMMHDFVTTRAFVIFLVCPATFRPENVLTGQPIRWEPELGTRIGVMPRDGGSGDVIWFDTDPCYVFHPMNAYQDGNRIIIDAVRYERVPLFDGGEVENSVREVFTARLVRWTLDLERRALTLQPLDDLPIEFPRLDERRAGLSYRHGYAAGRVGNPTDGGPFNALVHYDLQRETRTVRNCGSTVFPSEPVFVPRNEGAPEGDGFLLVTTFRQEENRSDLLILDATAIDHPPIAAVHLPHRIPHGFHGNWAEGVELQRSA